MFKSDIEKAMKELIKENKKLKDKKKKLKV
jgi:hypothetical protein